MKIGAVGEYGMSSIQLFALVGILFTFHSLWFPWLPMEETAASALGTLFRKGLESWDLLVFFGSTKAWRLQWIHKPATFLGRHLVTASCNGRQRSNIIAAVRRKPWRVMLCFPRDCT